MNYEGSSAVLQFCSQEGSAVLQFCSSAVLQLVESDHWNYFVNLNMEKSLAVLQSAALANFIPFSREKVQIFKLISTFIF
jgi:hypothetical protein